MSSTEIFSQQDIDALLGGGAPAVTKKRTELRHVTTGDENVQIYDFRRPHRVSKDRLRALEAMYERMAKALEAWLIAKLRGPIEVTLQSVEQLSFGEFAMSLPSPCASFIFDISGSGGQQGVIDFGLDFTFHVVDRFFGGAGTHLDLARPLTPIEKRANRLVADRVASLLAETWRDNVHIDVGISGFESVPEILQTASREDPMLVTNLKLRCDQITSLIGICVPFVSLEKFFSGQGKRRVKHPGGGQSHEVRAARFVTEGLLLETSVPLSARLPQFELSMREIGALEVGSVIATGIRLDAEVEVLIAGESRLRAAPGRAPGGRSLALQVLHSLPRPETAPQPQPLDIEDDRA
jgi:flagellar motor switch protein FliM